MCIYRYVQPTINVSIYICIYIYVYIYIYITYLLQYWKHKCIHICCNFRHVSTFQKQSSDSLRVIKNVFEWFVCFSLNGSSAKWSNSLHNLSQTKIWTKTVQNIFNHTLALRLLSHTWHQIISSTSTVLKLYPI